MSILKQRMSRDDPYYKELQAKIDAKAQFIKTMDSSDIRSLRDKIKEVLDLYHEKEQKFGLSLDNRLGLAIIKSQYKSLVNACNMLDKGLSKEQIKGFGKDL